MPVILGQHKIPNWTSYQGFPKIVPAADDDDDDDESDGGASAGAGGIGPIAEEEGGE